MIKKIFTVLGMIVWGCAAQAQTWIEDSVSLNPGYANDVYYSLKNGAQRVEGNKNWHLGFSLSILDSASVWANHNGGTTFVKVFNINKDYSQWATVTLADTTGATMLYNNDQGWYQGAFNDIANSSPFDFGWGLYDPSIHTIAGNKVFIVRAEGLYYKVCIKELEAIAWKWKFEVAPLTTAGAGTSVTDSISKQNYSSNLFAYYNLATMTDTNREPAVSAWDLQFMRYTTNDPLSGSLPNNTVVGVLHNRGVEAVRVDQVEVDTTFKYYDSYKSSVGPMISTIGYNWKSFDLATNTWNIATPNSYIIKDKIGNWWQLEFLDFGGSSTGKVYFHKRMVEPLKVNDINSIVSQYSVYPNPSSSNINLIVESKMQIEATLVLTDITGKQIQSKKIALNKGVNAFSLPISSYANGNYILSVFGNQIQLSHKFSISK